MQWVLKRKDEKWKHFISKLLWQLFVKPWDLLVPPLDRKHTNKQSTWDLWEPLSGRLLGLGRPLPVVKAPWKQTWQCQYWYTYTERMDQFWDLWTLTISIKWWPPPAQETCRQASPPHQLAFFPGQSRPPNLNKGHFFSFLLGEYSPHPD